MSVVPIGCANQNTSMYENNTDVVVYDLTPSSLLGIPPGGQIEYSIVPSVAGLGNANSKILVDVACIFTGTCPPGDFDTSTVQIDIISAPVGPPIPPPTPYDPERDVSTSAYTGFASGFPPWTIRATGIIVPTLAVTNLRCLITRIGGNPAVDFDCTRIITKIKVLD